MSEMREDLPQWEIDKKRIETISDSIYLAIDDHERALLLILDELATLRAENAELRKDRAWEHNKLIEVLETVTPLRAQVAAQQVRWERAKAVLREMTSDDDRFFCESVRCVFCNGLSWEHPSHKDDCPVVQARTLLGEGGQ